MLVVIRIVWRDHDRVHGHDRVRGQNRDSVLTHLGPMAWSCVRGRVATRIRGLAQRWFIVQ